MATIPPEAYGLVGAALGLVGAVFGASISLATTRFSQRNQRILEEKKIREARAQLVFKEKSEKVYQLAIDLSAIAYSFLWITWSAEYDDLDQKMLEKYWDQIVVLMPRLYANSILVAGLDDGLGKLAESFVEQADKLDVSIGEATLNLSKKNLMRLKELHAEAEAFAESIAKELADGIKKNRLIVGRTQGT
jgi:hypothetical protein